MKKLKNNVSKPGNDGPAPDPQKYEKPAEKEPADDLKLPPLK